MKHIFTIIIVIISLGAKAQGLSQLKPVKRLKLCSASLNAGAIIETNIKETPEDFQKLAPNSNLLTANSIKKYDAITGYKTFGSSTISSNTIATVMLGFKFGNKNKTDYITKYLLRVGASYFSETNLSANFFTTETSTYDTLVSLLSQQAVYLDSVSRKYYSMTYVSNQLRLDISLLLRSNPYERWSLYTGIGLTAGTSIKAKTTINYEQKDALESRYQNGTNYVTIIKEEFKTESFKNKSNIIASLYVPLGADFRIGNNSEFWKRSHIFYELRPSFNITQIPELRTIANIGFMHGLGVRFSF
jgi:hypothetical protein